MTAAAASSLRARPGAATTGLPPGLHRIAPLQQERQEQAQRQAAWLRIPEGRTGQALPLAVMLHGSGGQPQQGLELLEPFATQAGLAVLAPASAAYTWDGVLGAAGPDIVELDAALQWVFAHQAVDAARLSVGGFSDGASQALSLGLGNGDLFGRIVALSPGFVPRAQPEGQPAVFIAHGTGDRVLPIGRCSRVIVPALRRAGYGVDYREFDSGHEIPPAIADAAVHWLLR